MLIVRDLESLPGLNPQDAGQMPGFVAAQLCRAVADRVYKESTSGHGTYCSDSEWLQSLLMIALLRGVLAEKHPNQAIVETGGVGYDVTIPVSTFTKLPDAGSEVRLRIHTHVREDALALYGFLTQDEKALFEKLISVSGIGPTLAVKILSGLAAPDLVLSIRRGEVEKLVKLPGVGKKTAERLVLELRDKLPEPAAEDGHPQPSLSGIDEDVLSALLNLGCTRVAAEAAVRKARAGGTPDQFEPLFRKALELAR